MFLLRDEIERFYGIKCQEMKKLFRNGLVFISALFGITAMVLLIMPALFVAAWVVWLTFINEKWWGAEKIGMWHPSSKK